MPKITWMEKEPKKVGFAHKMWKNQVSSHEELFCTFKKRGISRRVPPALHGDRCLGTNHTTVISSFDFFLVS